MTFKWIHRNESPSYKTLFTPKIPLQTRNYKPTATHRQSLSKISKLHMFICLWRILIMVSIPKLRMNIFPAICVLYIRHWQLRCFAILTLFYSTKFTTSSTTSSKTIRDTHAWSLYFLSMFSLNVSSIYARYILLNWTRNVPVRSYRQLLISYITKWYQMANYLFGIIWRLSSALLDEKEATISQRSIADNW